MRYLVFVLLVSLGLVAKSESASVVNPIGLFPGSDLVEQEMTESTGHFLALGAMKKINHELLPEKSILVPGRKDASTYYLPEARGTKQIAEYYKSEVMEAANILFECQGRACGSSSFWANNHFKSAILYGPEQYQHYLIAQRSVPEQMDEGDYIVIYVGQRATRKIYVHIEYISRTKP